MGQNMGKKQGVLTRSGLHKVCCSIRRIISLSVLRLLDALPVVGPIDNFMASRMAASALDVLAVVPPIVDQALHPIHNLHERQNLVYDPHSPDINDYITASFSERIN
eukprot:1397462-Amphidinium_carterae.1